MRNLGLMRERGEGTARNRNKTAELYEKSDEHGGSVAQYNLELTDVPQLQRLLKKNPGRFLILSIEQHQFTPTKE